ncbi:MAG: hypothetical protein ACTSU5_10650 [Promethearchaeota archaeon]
MMPSRRERCAFAAFLALLAALNVTLYFRLVEYPSSSVGDIEPAFWVAISLLGAIGVALLALFRPRVGSGRSPGRVGEHPVGDSAGSGTPGRGSPIHWVLLALAGALGWSLRGVWGHQTGAVFWGCTVFPVVFLSPRADKGEGLASTLTGTAGLALGAMFKFATYPVVPRLVVFSIWGMTGGVFLGFGRWLHEWASLGASERGRGVAKYSARLGAFGFLGMALGLLLERGLYSDAGWLPGWSGGWLTGAAYALCVGYAVRTSPPARPGPRHGGAGVAVGSVAVGGVAVRGVEGEGAGGDFLGAVSLVVLVSVAPVIPVFGTIAYLTTELGTSPVPAWEVAACISWVLASVPVVLKFRGVLFGTRARATLAATSLASLWPGTLAAIWRHAVEGRPDFWAALHYQFELASLVLAVVCTVFLLSLLQLHRRPPRPSPPRVPSRAGA